MITIIYLFTNILIMGPEFNIDGFDYSLLIPVVVALAFILSVVVVLWIIGRRVKTRKREQLEVKVSNLHEDILDELKEEYGIDKEEDNIVNQDKNDSKVE